MWLESLDCKALKLMANNSSSMYIASTPDGKILWANRAFLDWSKYTSFEITQKNWKDISLKDASLEADLKELESLNDYSLSYTVQKSYIPKNSAPQIGMLHVTKYPPQGEIEFCWCRWEPFYNGTAKALESSLKAQKEFTDAINNLTLQVKMMTDKTVEENALASILDLMKKYPKASWLLFAVVITTFVGNNATSLFQRFGFFGPEIVKVLDEKK